MEINEEEGESNLNTSSPSLPSSSSISAIQNNPTSNPQSTAVGSQAMEDVVGKYKRLLNLAKTNLESNQKLIAEKDLIINQLKASLEEEKSHHHHHHHHHRNNQTMNHENEEIYPKNLLRRVDIDQHIWILVEYHQQKEDSWLLFDNEQELDDFIQRIPGIPLQKPSKCLTIEESNHIQHECKKAVDRIVEEFRRYKIKTEIARKQKDKESDRVVISPVVTTTSSHPSLERIMTNAAAGYIDNSLNRGGTYDNDASISSLQKLQSRILSYEQEIEKWKTAYERAVHENEQLRSRGETQLAAQWRDRYEVCNQEKEELLEQVKMLQACSKTNPESLESSNSLSNHYSGHIMGSNDSFSIERAYMQLKDEYKEFRKKVMMLEQEREKRRERKKHESHSDHHHQHHTSTHHHHHSNTSSALSHQSLSSSSSSSNSMESSKLLYIRNLILQYLSCKDPILKEHMENAIITIFRYNEKEKQSIQLRKQDETSTDSLIYSSFASFVSNFSTT